MSTKRYGQKDQPVKGNGVQILVRPQIVVYQGPRVPNKRKACDKHGNECNKMASIDGRSYVQDGTQSHNWA